MKNAQFSVFVGIDVSSEKLDIAWRTGEQWVSQTVQNTWADAQKFAADLFVKMPDACCIAEHTGTYSSKIALALFEAGLKISLVTPAQSKAFDQMKHRTTKNDR